MIYDQLPDEIKAKIVLNWQKEDDSVKWIFNADIFDINGNIDKVLIKQYAEEALNDKEKYDNLLEIFISLFR